MQYSVASLDVLGNEIEGWDVNNLFQLGTVSMVDDVLEDDQQVFNVLTEAGYIDGISTADCYIDGDDNFSVTIRLIENDKPILQLDAQTR